MSNQPSATLTVPASTLERGRDNAREAFTNLFGTSAFKITAESAESDCVDMAGRVLTWRCTFTAELA